MRFCKELSKTMRLEPAYKIDGERAEWFQRSTGFRLPTEAEWKYACRSGSTTRYASGDLEKDLNTVGWWWKNSDEQTRSVGRKNPNAWGIYDMHGNVWEWVWDCFDKYNSEIVRSTTDLLKSSRRVFRGGSWILKILNKCLFSEVLLVLCASTPRICYSHFRLFNSSSCFLLSFLIAS